MIPADFAEMFGSRNAPAEAIRTGKRDGKLKQAFAIARADDALSAFGGILAESGMAALERPEAR